MRSQQNNKPPFKTRVMFPGEPHLGNIIKRSVVAGKAGLEVRLTWSRSTEKYISGDDYLLLKNFGYLGELRKTGPDYNRRTYASITPKGIHLFDWAAGTQQNSMPEIRSVPNKDRRRAS